ncbi:MAG TPA: FAD-dependent 5-carboxymethylaminomethyl-2-thiouridine(34) oxidoreductase MnmC, partial [Patescibacteria group bacterium]|nr:FAD-dependent 5-carboxymethylaminomethyl-2-thiouridine(34) oxidoreductase MnmC [Patescibacteria group bacterium]
QKLHYLSFEKYPLSWDECARALAQWRGVFGGRTDRLRALYPLRVPGFHRIMLNEQVTLTLIFDDVNDALPQLDAPSGVDAWFLDGFAPSKNPEMWTDKVFAEMARLSREGTTAATFTVAGIVKRGLEAAGFAVEKKQGFGRKREMLTARFEGKNPVLPAPKINRVAIIGGGLAGTAAAFVLKRQGLQPVLFEKGSALASGASGNPEGLYNPRFSQFRTPESDFHTAAWAQGVRTFAESQGASDVAFNPCGSLHLAMDAEREKKLRGALANWGWHSSHMHWLDIDEASRRAGVALKYEALCLPDAGTVSPVALCNVWATGVDVRLNTDAQAIDLKEFDAVILACGTAVKSFEGLAELPIHAVRGQMTEIKATHTSHHLKTNLCYGGYIAPESDGIHRVGATFQQWLDDPNPRAEDDADNLSRLAAVLPMQKPEIVGSRVGFRCSSRDRSPLVGQAQGLDNVYLSVAHGSHGLCSSLAAAHLIADLLTGAPRSLPRDSIAILDPARFEKRAAKKEKRRD